MSQNSFNFFLVDLPQYWFKRTDFGFTEKIHNTFFAYNFLDTTPIHQFNFKIFYDTKSNCQNSDHTESKNVKLSKLFALHQRFIQQKHWHISTYLSF